MTRLNQATSDTRRLARKMAEDAKKKGVMPKTWKGKKIIPLSEWRKKFNIFTLEWKDYFPEEFADDLLFPSNGEESEFDRHQNEWWSQFVGYMEVARPASYGKHRCRKCILNPKAYPKTTSIRDAIVKTQVSGDGKPLEFPCRVVNMYQCPYKDKKDMSRLLTLGEVWRILDHAIVYHWKLDDYKITTYTINYVKNIVGSRYTVGAFPCKIERAFDKVKFSKLDFGGHEGLFDTITTRDKLKIILQEYIDALLDGSEKNWHVLQLVQYFKDNPDYFLDIFEQAKDAITLEELKDTNGETIQNVKDYQKWLEGRKSLVVRSSWSRDGAKTSDVCTSCGEFANINCVNCNAWLCLNHWRSHGIEVHNYGKPAN